MNVKSGSYFDQTLTVLLTMKIYSDFDYTEYIYSHDALIGKGNKSDYIECSQNNNVVRRTASKKNRSFLLSTHIVILTFGS